MTRRQRIIAWAVLVLIGAAVLFSILHGVSQRLSDAEAAAQANGAALTQANDKVTALGAQVQGLGETPTVSTEPLPPVQILVGPRGLMGLTGPPGRDGLDGLTITGPAGDTGIQGTAGNLGPVGPAGSDGTDGANGAKGTDGKDGAAATDQQIADAIAAYCAVNTCTPGPQGEPGPAGPQGEPGPAGGTPTP